MCLNCYCSPFLAANWKVLRPELLIKFSEDRHPKGATTSLSEENTKFCFETFRFHLTCRCCLRQAPHSAPGPNMKSYLLFLAIIGFCCAVTAFNPRALPKPNQSDMMRTLIDKGPFSKWLSYKSQITKADIQQVTSYLTSKHSNLPSPRLPPTPADLIRPRSPPL